MWFDLDRKGEKHTVYLCAINCCVFCCCSVEDILTDSDSEIEDMETDQAPRTKRKQISTWINEDESTIVDFTDPTTASRITGIFQANVTVLT